MQSLGLDRVGIAALQHIAEVTGLDKEEVMKRIFEAVDRADQDHVVDVTSMSIMAASNFDTTTIRAFIQNLTMTIREYHTNSAPGFPNHNGLVAIHQQMQVSLAEMEAARYGFGLQIDTQQDQDFFTVRQHHLPAMPVFGPPPQSDDLVDFADAPLDDDDLMVGMSPTLVFDESEKRNVEGQITGEVFDPKQMIHHGGRCTNYAAHHIGDEWGTGFARGSRSVTTLSRKSLDEALDAINNGRAIYLGANNRNCYVLVGDKILGVHKQPGATIFPHGKFGEAPNPGGQPGFDGIERAFAS